MSHKITYNQTMYCFLVYTLIIFKICLFETLEKLLLITFI